MFCCEFDAEQLITTVWMENEVRAELFLLTPHSRVAGYSIKVYVAVSAALPPFTCLAF
jgi:hypothetical protein